MALRRPSPYVVATVVLGGAAASAWWVAHDTGVPGPYVTVIADSSPGSLAPPETFVPSGTHLTDLDLHVATVDGAAADLADLAGRPMLLNVWASTCRPCRAEMPVLQRFVETTDAVVVVGVNPLDDADTLTAFLQEVGATYPQYRDPDGAVLAAFSVAALPATIAVTADGRVVAVHLGELDDATLEALAAAATGSE